MNRFQVRKVAVLGAGVMGAQIAAHLVNVKVPVVLFDLPAKEGPNHGSVTRAIDTLTKLKPSPIGTPGDLALIQPANYEENLDLLAGCDLVIEAIAEAVAPSEYRGAVQHSWLCHGRVAYFSVQKTLPVFAQGSG